jgi:ATP-dependent DNA ligase
MRQQQMADRAPARFDRPADLRPMPFGTARPDTIANPVAEPVWGGIRVLVHVSGGSAVVRDPSGDELEVPEPLRAGIVAAAQASELVVDGHLVPAPLRDTTGVRLRAGTDAVRTVGDMGRHFFIGGLGRRPDRVTEAEAAAAAASNPLDGPMALIAVDLLWLDGESLLDVPLLERKRILESVLMDGELVRRTVTVRPPVEMWHAQWSALGFREVAIKGANSRYTPGEPSREWAITFIRRR